MPSTVPPPLLPVAADGFGDAESVGWGNADLGGVWTTDSPIGWFLATDGRGRISLTTPGTGAGAFVPMNELDTDVTVTVSAEGTISGGGTYLSVVGRRVGVSDYRAKVRLTAVGGVELFLTRASGVSRADGVEIDLASTVIARNGWSADRPLKVRVQVTGVSPTTVRAKVWPADSVEPSTWNLSANDTTPVLQATGSIGLVAYLSSTATSPIVAVFDDLDARRVLLSRS